MTPLYWLIVGTQHVKQDRTDVTSVPCIFADWNVSGKASVTPEPDKVTEWKTGVAFTVTAEDGSTAKWVVRLTVATATEVLSISAKNQARSALIDDGTSTVLLYLADENAKKSVTIDNVVLSDGASHDLKLSGLDLSSPVKFTVTASDGESKADWTISAKVYVPPKLESITVGTGSVKGVIDQESGKVFFEMSYKNDLDLRSLKVQSIGRDRHDLRGTK